MSLKTSDAIPATRSGVSPSGRVRQFVRTDTLTDELAAFSGISANGTRPKSVSELMRKTLVPPSATDGVELLARGSEELAEALRRREDEERVRIAAEDARVKREYETFLASRGIEGGTGEHDGDGDGTDESGTDTEDHTGTGEPDRELDQNAAIRALYAEADRAAARIRANAAAATTTTTTTSAPADQLAAARARDVIAQDIDRLWDWLRRDPSSASLFFRRNFETSIELHQYVTNMINGKVPVRSIDILTRDGYQHVGFFALHPIDLPARCAMLHFYLAPDVHGYFAVVFPYVLTGARTIVPSTLNLAVYAPDTELAALSELLPKYGFTPKVTFVLEGKK